MKIKKFLKISFPKSLNLLVGNIICVFLLTSCSQGIPDADKNSHIYFGAKTIGPSVNIYSVDMAGSIKRITDDSHARDVDMAITGTGQLAFSSNRKPEYKIVLNKNSETYKVFTQSVKDLEPKVLFEGKDSEFSPKYSPDEKTIAFIQKKKGYQTIVLAPSDGKEKPKSLLSGKLIYNFDWSPNGKMIAIAHSEDDFSFLSLITIDSGKIENALSFPTKHPHKDYKPSNDDIFAKQVVYVSWSPDGKTIAYIRSPMQKADRQLRLYNIESKQDTLISKADQHAQDGVDWTSDSQGLLYSALIGYEFHFDEKLQRQIYKGGMHIMHYNLADNKTKQLTNGDHLYRHPTFSPSEKSIAFYYADNLDAREYQLMQMDVSGKNPKKLFDRAAPESTILWQ